MKQELREILESVSAYPGHSKIESVLDLEGKLVGTFRVPAKEPNKHESTQTWRKRDALEKALEENTCIAQEGRKTRMQPVRPEAIVPPPTTDTENPISIEPATAPPAAMPPFKPIVDKKKASQSKGEASPRKSRKPDEKTLAELKAEVRKATEKLKVKNYGYVKKFKPKTLESRLINKPRKITNEAYH